MRMRAYSQVLALPRVRFTILLMFFARLPLTAMGVLLTLHVVRDLGLGYADAGLVGAASTAATAAGSPFVGRMLDRFGLRRVVLVCGLFSVMYWLLIPHVAYPVLVIFALLAGLLAVPAQSLTRQFLTALVPEEQRRTAFSLDMSLAEASYIVGPAVAVYVMTQVSSTLALSAMGLWLGVVAVVLYRTNLPIHSGVEDAGGGRPPLRSWLNRHIVGSLVITIGSTFTLIGTEITIIAVLGSYGQTSWTGVIIGVMSVASIAGGLAHGGVRRSLPQWALAMLLGALLVPVMFVDHPWWLMAIALIPMNLMCTPALASSAETISKFAQPRVRGEAMGLLSMATGFGLAAGNPTVGFAIDHIAPNWGFVVAGGGGFILALTGASLLFRVRRNTVTVVAASSANLS